MSVLHYTSKFSGVLYRTAVFVVYIAIHVRIYLQPYIWRTERFRTLQLRALDVRQNVVSARLCCLSILHIPHPYCTRSKNAIYRCDEDFQACSAASMGSTTRQFQSCKGERIECMIICTERYEDYVYGIS